MVLILVSIIKRRPVPIHRQQTLGYRACNIETPERHPPSEDVLQKMSQEEVEILTKLRRKTS